MILTFVIENIVHKKYVIVFLKSENIFGFFIFFLKNDVVRKSMLLFFVV